MRARSLALALLLGNVALGSSVALAQGTPEGPFASPSPEAFPDAAAQANSVASNRRPATVVVVPTGADASTLVLPPAPALLPPTLQPLAGYANGNFYLRDPHDWFVLFPKGRLQIDSYNFLNRDGNGLKAGTINNSSADTRPKDTIFVRRARVELQGSIFKHFDFMIAGEFGSVPATGAYGTITDAYVIVDYLDFLKIQAGQFDAPFTLENRTSDKYFDFMERSMVVRDFGEANNKEDGGMAFGWLPKHIAYYSVGIFNGDGQSFKSSDSRPAYMGRAFISPLAPFANGRTWMRDMWVGGGFYYKHAVNEGGAGAASTTAGSAYDLAGMTTQGGLSFFSSSYGNGNNAAGLAQRAHLAPWGDQVKWSLEANIPWKKLGARFEFVHQSLALAEYNDTNPANATLTRSAGVQGGKLDGSAYYIELYGWILGDSSFLETPGLETAPRVRPFQPTEPKWGLMLALKYEHLGFDVTGLPAGTPAMPGGTSTTDAGNGHYTIDTIEAGLNGWATKHVRLTANYLANYIDGDSANVKKNLFYKHWEHELLFRIGIAL